MGCGARSRGPDGPGPEKVTGESGRTCGPKKERRAHREKRQTHTERHRQTERESVSVAGRKE